MLFRRRKLPPDLRTALRKAARAAPPRRRRGPWWLLERLLPGALVPSLIVIVAYLAWQQSGPWMPPAATPEGPAAPMAAPSRPAALPRVVHGTVSPAPTAPPPASSFTVRVGVVDGDTLAAGEERLRISGIDAPEMGQSCERRGAPYACGEAARAAMMRVVGRGAVTCETLDVDRYGRRVVRCVGADGRDIAAALVAQGWALAYRQFSLDYVAQEDAARARGLGLWAGRFEPPWAWRQRQRR
jgi:endonuclease YncB( thermonuclease family)